MVSLKIYVEGGGDSKSLHIECTRGFSRFLYNAGFAGKMPRVVACGGRAKAFDRFVTSIQNKESAMLLIDSEADVSAYCQQGDNAALWKPWEHLKNRTGDGWEKPAAASDADCHLMVQCMEAWFLADRDALQKYFGQGFAPASLPPEQSGIETIAKNQIYQSLDNATKNAKTKGRYDKGDHSFKILALLDPARVTSASPWAKRFIDQLKQSN